MVVATHVYGRAEVETGVSLVHDLQVLPLDERAHLGLPGQDVRDQLTTDFLLVVFLIESLISTQWGTMGA